MLKNHRRNFHTFSFLLLAAELIWVQPSFAALTYPGCADLTGADFKEVVLVSRGTTTPAALVTDAALIEPVGLYVHTDARVYYVERTNATGQPNSTTATGRIRMFNPATNTLKTIATLNVATGVGTGQSGNRELGLRFFTLDPNFNSNHWAYVYYMPRTTVSNRQVDTMLMSRFTMPTLDSLDLTSEKKLLKMAWTPGICCHQGGGMDWDAQGNLYMSTGNNADNIDGYGPMDPALQANSSGDPKDQATRDNAARTANTMDWRGKVLRIHPDSSVKGYRIPAGNLRQKLYQIGGAWVAGQDTNKILPEVYSFGHRNPYTLYVDKPTGWVTLGEVGPDAGTASATRGPAGRDEFNLLTEPGFSGFPFFIGDNQAYNMINFPTSTYGTTKQNPDSVSNASPNNTGITKLPHAIPSILPESKNTAENTTWNLGTGSGTAATTGPIYHYDGNLNSSKKLPPHLNGKWIITEASKNPQWGIKLVSLNSTGTAVTAVDSIPGLAGVIKSVIPGGGYGIVDMKMGSEGALYIAHYSSANFNSTATTRISRIEYTGTCLPGTVSVARTWKERLLGGILYSSVSGRLVWPEGMRTAEVFNLQGKKVWKGRRSADVMALPADLKAGIFRVRFSP